MQEEIIPEDKLKNDQRRAIFYGYRKNYISRLVVNNFLKSSY